MISKAVRFSTFCKVSIYSYKRKNKTRKGLESYVTRCACKDVGTGLHMTLVHLVFADLSSLHPSSFHGCTHFWALARARTRAIRACAIKTTPILEPAQRQFPSARPRSL